MEKDQEPRSAKRSEREGRQFFKIKAVKPNLQVCRRKRVEVVKILVCCIRARHPLLPPSLLSSLFIPAFPRTLPAPFERRRPRPWPPLPVVKLPHETFLMSNRGDLRLSLSLSLFFPSSTLPSSPTTISLSRSPSVGLSPISYFCGAFSCLSLPSRHRSVFRGSLFPLLFFRGTPTAQLRRGRANDRDGRRDARYRAQKKRRMSDYERLRRDKRTNYAQYRVAYPTRERRCRPRIFVNRKMYRM